MTEGGSFGEDAFSDPVVSPRLSGFLSSAEFTLVFYMIMISLSQEEEVKGQVKGNSRGRLCGLLDS